MYDMTLYPDALIPKDNYTNEIKLDALQKKHDYNVSRRVKGCFDDVTFEEEGARFLKSSVIEDFDEQLSMNLLGAGFRIQDTKFHQVKPADTPWREHEVVNKLDYGESVMYEEDSSALVFNASDLTKTIHYPREFQTKNDADKFRADLGIQEAIQKNIEPKVVRGVVSRSFLKHSPTYTNYWHVELQIEPSPKEKPLAVHSSTVWKQTLFDTYRKSIFADIEQKEIKEDKDCCTVEEEWYFI